jgi:hypothetical protein
MKKPIVLIYLLVPGLMLAACAPVLQAARAPAPSELAIGQPAVVEGIAPPAAAPATGGFARQDLSAGAATETDRLLVQTAQLSLVVKDPVAKAAAIRQMAEGMGGYLVSSSVYKSTYGNGVTADNASITVRVPSERLQDALSQIKSGAVEVRNENVNGQDVTAQYVDLQSRLRNLQAAEAQLMKIMDSATKTEDVLAVYNQLVSVRGEIETIRGQMKYFEESAAFAAITAELIPDAAAQPIAIGGWHPQGTVKAAVEALVHALQWLVDAAIWLLICVLPVALLVGLPVFLIVRAARRRRGKSAPKDAASA